MFFSRNSNSQILADSDGKVTGFLLNPTNENPGFFGINIPVINRTVGEVAVIAGAGAATGAAVITVIGMAK